MMHLLIIVLFCLALAWNRAPVLLQKDLSLGLKHSSVDLSVLVDNIDGGPSDIGKGDDLLDAHVPPHLDAFGLELGGVDDGST